MKFDSIMRQKGIRFITDSDDLKKAYIHEFRLYPKGNICDFDGIGFYLLASILHRQKDIPEKLNHFTEQAKQYGRAFGVPIGIILGDEAGISGLGDWSARCAAADIDSFVYPVEFRGKKQHKWDREPITEDQVWQIADMLIPDPSASEAEETRAERDTVMIVGLFFSGMRIGEFLAMRRHWMSTSNGVLKIMVPLAEGKFKCKTKAGARNIYITDPAAIAILSDWYDEHPDGLGISDVTAWERCKEIGEHAGIEQRLTPHVLRHSHQSWLAAKGMSPEFMMLQMGHSSAKISLEVYTHQTEEIPVELDKLK